MKDINDDTDISGKYALPQRYRHDQEAVRGVDPSGSGYLALIVLDYNCHRRPDEARQDRNISVDERQRPKTRISLRRRKHREERVELRARRGINRSKHRKYPSTANSSNAVFHEGSCDPNIRGEEPIFGIAVPALKLAIPLC
jgi:hypothetical protein